MQYIVKIIEKSWLTHDVTLPAAREAIGLFILCRASH